MEIIKIKINILIQKTAVIIILAWDWSRSADISICDLLRICIFRITKRIWFLFLTYLKSMVFITARKVYYMIVAC